MKLLVWLSCALAIGMKANAQRVSFAEPKEDSSMAAGPNQAVVVIRSNSDKLVMTHNMGEEKGVRAENADGTYSYTINYRFPEEDDEEFIKSTFLVRLPVGQQEFMLVLRKGKGYSGTFNENLITIERNNDGLFPQSKAAKVTFLYAMKDLSMECSGRLCFASGQAVQPADANFSPSVKQEGGELYAYSIEFMLDEAKKTPLFVRRPVFKIKIEGSNAIEVDLGGDLEFKKSYSYIIVNTVKIVEKESSFDELLAKAQAKEKEADFFAAANAYQDARSHKDCPADKREELEIQMGRMNSARRFLFYAEKFERQGARVERKEGFAADSVFIYYRGAIRSYKKVLEYVPGAAEFERRAEELDEKLKPHPMNSKVTTVAVKYQEITGRHPNGGGIPIYASYTSGKLKPKSDDKPLGTTRSDGSFRVVFKDRARRPPYLFFYGDAKSYRIDDSTTEIIF